MWVLGIVFLFGTYFLVFSVRLRKRFGQAMGDALHGREKPPLSMEEIERERRLKTAMYTLMRWQL